MYHSPEDWLRIVRERAPEAFVTGSRAFGTSREPTDAFADMKNLSDTDIAVLVENRGAVKKLLDSMYSACEDSMYNNGFKYSTQHGDINIVPLHPLDFVCWKLTTKHMQEVIALCPEAKARIRCRETKLGIFEALTGIHKMLVPYDGKEECEELASRIEVVAPTPVPPAPREIPF